MHAGFFVNFGCVFHVYLFINCINTHTEYRKPNACSQNNWIRVIIIMVVVIFDKRKEKHYTLESTWSASEDPKERLKHVGFFFRLAKVSCG